MFIFKYTEPSPLQDSAYPDPPPVVPHPESIDTQTAYRGRHSTVTVHRRGEAADLDVRHPSGPNPSRPKFNYFFFGEFFSRKPLLGSFRKLPEASQKLPEASQKLPEASQRLAEASRKLSRGFRKIPEGSQKIPEASQKLLEASQRLPKASLRLPEASLRLPEASLRFLEASQKIPEASGSFPEDSGAGPVSTERTRGWSLLHNVRGSS